MIKLNTPTVSQDYNANVTEQRKCFEGNFLILVNAERGDEVTAHGGLWIKYPRKDGLDWLNDVSLQRASSYDLACC